MADLEDWFEQEDIEYLNDSEWWGNEVTKKVSSKAASNIYNYISFLQQTCGENAGNFHQERKRRQELQEKCNDSLRLNRLLLSYIDASRALPPDEIVEIQRILMWRRFNSIFVDESV